MKDQFLHISSIKFANPGMFWLLLLLVPIFVWYIFKKRKSQATIRISNAESFRTGYRSVKRYLRHILFIFRVLVFVLLIITLARPQTTQNWQNETTEGIDIAIALDISGSMLARDFTPNRLEAAKDVAMQFIAGRPLDRIGLVCFSGESFTQCPLTSDHAVLLNLFSEIKQGMIVDGTALGVGLANAVSRLKESKAVSKVIIFITDGVNNAGEISPETAADLAAKFGIRVYTVGMGKNGYAPFPVQTVFGTQYQDMEVKIDEETLKLISQKTDGQYFRATNNKKLKEIYEQIDKLEKSKIDVQKFSTREDIFFPFLAFAIILLILEIVLKQTVFRNIP
jgi:Ca-activated chloride channel family protein